MSKKKFGLALGAGGATGVAHVGFLKVLEENGIKPDVVSGTSIGSVVGALYCAGYPLEKMEERIEILRQDDIIDFDLFFFNKLSLTRGKKVAAILKELIGEDTRFSDLKIPFGCVAVDLLSCEKKHLTEGLVWQSALASSAIPLAFPPVEMDGMMLVDGGILDRVPGALCKQLGADIVIGVDVLGAPIKQVRPTNMFRATMIAYRIMEYEMTKMRTSNVNYMIELSQPEVDPHRVKNLNESYEYGKKAALDHLDAIKELLRDK